MQSYQTEDSFELPVEFQGKQLLLPSKFVQMGYTYKIFVTAADNEIIFEPDEERNFRAVIEGENRDKVSVQLIGAIASELEKNFK